MTLLILAAGLGSRYGGLKQLDPMTDAGEFIIDFSIHDAIAAGFDRVVFVIKRENLELFRETIGKRFEKKVHVEYAFQELDDLPQGFVLPSGREKPWGTAHALLAARHIIHEPFAVINADDFYGRGAYRALAHHLSAVNCNAPVAEYCMVGYVLQNTLTEHGFVSRGVCEIEDGFLTRVTERTKIRREGDHAIFCEGDAYTALPLDATVSMNCWGFTPDVFEKIERGFEKFLSLESNDLKREYYLPFSIMEILDDGACSVRVYSSQDAWYGVTYREDHDAVASALKHLKDTGIYPQKLNETENER